MTYKCFKRKKKDFTPSWSPRKSVFPYFIDLASRTDSHSGPRLCSLYCVCRKLRVTDPGREGNSSQRLRGMLLWQFTFLLWRVTSSAITSLPQTLERRIAGRGDPCQVKEGLSRSSGYSSTGGTWPFSLCSSSIWVSKSWNFILNAPARICRLPPADKRWAVETSILWPFMPAFVPCFVPCGLGDYRQHLHPWGGNRIKAPSTLGRESPLTCSPDSEFSGLGGFIPKPQVTSRCWLVLNYT